MSLGNRSAALCRGVRKKRPESATADALKSVPVSNVLTGVYLGPGA